MKCGKIWGLTRSLFKNDNFEVHRLEIKEGMKCSKHHHKFKHNIFYVESGEINVKVWKNAYKLIDITNLKAGDKTSVKPNDKHLFESVRDSIVYGIYYSEPISNDIIREDIGGTI